MKLAIAMSVIGLTCMAQTTPPKKDATSAPKLVPAVKPKPGVASGRVFAITPAGDIKPARLARVYLLSLDNLAAIHAWYDTLHLAKVQYMAQIKADQDIGLHKFDPNNNDMSVEDKNWENLRTSFLAAASPNEKNTMRALIEDDIDAQLALVKQLAEIERSLVRNNGQWSDEIECMRDLLNYDKALLGVRKSRWENKDWNQLLSAQADEEGQFRIVVPRSGKYMLTVRGRAGFNEAFWSADIIVATGAEAVVKLGQPEKACLVMK